MHRRKTRMFLALLPALLVWIGQVLAGQVGLLVALMCAERMHFGASCLWSDKLV